MPQKKKFPKDIQSQIIAVLDEMRPAIQMDGGDVEFVDYEEKTHMVKIRLVGACKSCPMSEVTLYQGIQEVLKERIPFIAGVVPV